MTGFSMSIHMGGTFAKITADMWLAAIAGTGMTSFIMQEHVVPIFTGRITDMCFYIFHGSLHSRSRFLYTIIRFLFIVAGNKSDECQSKEGRYQLVHG